MQLQTPRGKLLEDRHEALKAITRDTLHMVAAVTTSTFASVMMFIIFGLLCLFCFSSFRCGGNASRRLHRHRTPLPQRIRGERLQQGKRKSNKMFRQRLRLG